LTWRIFKVNDGPWLATPSSSLHKHLKPRRITHSVPPHLHHALYGPQSLNHQLFMAINHAHHPLLDPVMEALICLR